MQKNERLSLENDINVIDVDKEFWPRSFGDGSSSADSSAIQILSPFIDGEIECEPEDGERTPIPLTDFEAKVKREEIDNVLKELNEIMESE